MTVTMADSPSQQVDRLALYDAFDDAGRAWLDEIVRVFNDHGYGEALQAQLADEAVAPGAVDG